MTVLAKTYVNQKRQTAHRSYDVLKLREIVDQLAESHLELLQKLQSQTTIAPSTNTPSVEPGHVCRMVTQK